MKVQVQVKPNAKQQKIEVNSEGTWVISLKFPPVDGKANQELIQVLAKHFQVSRDRIVIKSGLSSRRKLIEIVQEQ